MQEREISGALAAVMKRISGQPGNIAHLERLSGGATKRTWAFEYHTDCNVSKLILQQSEQRSQTYNRSSGADAPRPPKLTAREDAQLMILAGSCGIPTPRVRAVLEADDHLGAGYITDRIDGETRGKRIVHEEQYSGARKAMGRQCGEILARIHAIPVEQAPFLTELSPALELKTYGNLVRELGVQHSALEYALRWIEERLPMDWKRSVVHSDFRTGNLIVGPDGVRCVLDWEIARVGDPMQDLGVLCMHTWRFGGAGECGGFASREDLFTAYEATSGLRIDPDRVRFWEAFSNLKWAIGCLRKGLAGRERAASASVEACVIGRRFEEPMWDFFEVIREA